MRGRDIMETALYGSIGYWANVRDVKRDGEGFPVEARVIVEGDEEASVGGLRVIRCGELVPAARRVVELYPNARATGDIRQALRDDDPGMIDAEAADMIVQVVLFEEVVYG